MIIGIYIHGHKPTDGGRFSYATQLMNRFNHYPTNHEFVFIIRSDALQYHKSYKIFKHLALYSALTGAFVVFKDGAKIKSTPLAGLKSKLKIPSLNFISEELKSQNFRSHFRQEKAFAQLVADTKIDMVYYAMHCDARHFDIPFYMTVWDLGHIQLPFFPEMYEKGEFTKREYYFERHLKRASKIVVESESGAYNLKKYYNVPIEKTILLPNFPGGVVETVLNEAFKKNTLDKYGLETNKFLFYPAQFWAHKNHVLIFKVLEELRTQHNIVLKVVLTGSDKGNLTFIKKYLAQFPEIKDQVIFPGFVDQEEMRVFYEAAFSLIMPTFLGPTNMPIVEALGCNCPVICSDLDGHREQAKEAALYFSPISYNEAIEKVELLYSNENFRDQLIEKGKIQYANYNKHIEESFKKLVESFKDFDFILSNFR